MDSKKQEGTLTYFQDCQLSPVSRHLGQLSGHLLLRTAGAGGQAVSQGGAALWPTAGIHPAAWTNSNIHDQHSCHQYLHLVLLSLVLQTHQVLHCTSCSPAAVCNRQDDTVGQLFHFVLDKDGKLIVWPDLYNSALVPTSLKVGLHPKQKPHILIGSTYFISLA